MKTIWYTTCKICHSRISNAGSGRPKEYCSGRCRSKTAKRLAQMRQYANRKSRKQGVPIRIKRKTNRSILNAEKIRRGECELHPLYNNGERKYVIAGLEYLFDMDHIDRTTKTKTIAKMMGDQRKSKQISNRKDESIAALVIEMSKCQVVCVECHRRKTVENRDWEQITNKLEPQIEHVSRQLSLFDD